MSLLPPAAHLYLNRMVDYDHGTEHKDLYQIACNMLHWDSLAPQLGLDDMDVADIKHDHHTAVQQRLGYRIVLLEELFRYILSLLISILIYSPLGLLHLVYGSKELLAHIMTS